MTRRSFSLGLVLALALGCATPTTLPPGAQSAAAPPTTAAPWPSSPPTIVHQGIGHPPAGFQVTPRGTWLVDAFYGELVVIEPDSGTVVWRFPMQATWPQLVMSADARYVAALGVDQYASGAAKRWLYAWDLALGRELFHREVALHGQRPGGLLITPGTIHVAECEKSAPPALNCGFRAFDLATGAPRQPPPAERVSLFANDDGWDWNPGPRAQLTQYSPDGRLVLISNGAARTIVFRADPPAVVTGLLGGCAELDGAGNVLWAPQFPSQVPEAEAALKTVGLGLRVMPSCPEDWRWERRSPGGRFQAEWRGERTAEPVDYARWPFGREQWFRIRRTDTGTSAPLPGFADTASIGLFPRIGLNHDLLWERDISEKPYHTLLQRASRTELPRWLPDAGAHARLAAGGAIYWGPDDSARLHVMRGDDLAELPPVPLRLPGGGKWFLDTSAPILPDGRFLIGTETGRLAVALGPPARIDRLPWVHITDGSTNISVAGQRNLLVGDVKQGQLIVDLKTHRRAGVICKYEKDRCSHALPASDGASAWVLIGTPYDEPADRLEQLSLPDGRLLASRRIPKLHVASSGSAATFHTRTGWLDVDRRFWVSGSDSWHACHSGLNDLCVITIVDLTTDPVGIRTVNAPGVGMLTGAPDSSFFAQTMPAQLGFNLFRPDGRTFLSPGAFGDGAYAFTPDGRFACTGDGCRMLRCRVNGRSEPADHPACRSLRRDGFSIDQELGRPPG